MFPSFGRPVVDIKAKKVRRVVSVQGPNGLKTSLLCKKHEASESRMVLEKCQTYVRNIAVCDQLF